MLQTKTNGHSELPVLEGVVLDREEQPISGPQIKFTQVPWIWAGALGLIIPVILVAGIAVMGGLIAIGTLFWFFRALFGPVQRRKT
ncbi:MAG: hypothetical protein AABZ55_11420 [Bdellovibrionota bacterium]